MADILQEVTIKEYIDLLKHKRNPERANEINEALGSKISGITGGFDLALFQLEKDHLLIQCKLLIAVCEFDEEKRERYSTRAKELRDAIKKKNAKKKKSGDDPYQSLIEWLFCLKKYFGSDVDQNSDLTCLVSATKQMLKFYQSQKEQIEAQQNKRKK
jgi:hypothetical protein